MLAILLVPVEASWSGPDSFRATVEANPHISRGLGQFSGIMVEAAVADMIAVDMAVVDTVDTVVVDVDVVDVVVGDVVEGIVDDIVGIEADNLVVE